MYDSTYIRYQESSSAWRQKLEWWLPRGQEEGEQWVSVQNDKKSSGDVMFTVM